MASKLILFIILTTLWFLLSGFFKPLFIFFGLSSSLICVLIYSKMQKVAGFKTSNKTPYYFSISFIIYTLWLIKEIIISSLKLSIEIWKEKPRIRPELKWLKNDINNDEATTIYANSITLTPGTISVHTADGEILVHAIHQDNIKDLESNKMHDKIKYAMKSNLEKN